MFRFVDEIDSHNIPYDEHLDLLEVLEQYNLYKLDLNLNIFKAFLTHIRSNVGTLQTH